MAREELFALFSHALPEKKSGLSVFSQQWLEKLFSLFSHALSGKSALSF
jgi:hypothetical protein